MIDDSLTPLSRLLASLHPAGAGFDIDVPEDWRQGRAIYGGLSAALCLAAVQSSHETLPPLRSAQVGFVGPAGPRIHIRPALLRRGKSAAFIGADVTAGGDFAARTMFCFGANRDSTLGYAGVPGPAVDAPEACGRFFEDENGRNQGPDFARHFDSRSANGNLPMSGSEDPDFLVWLRHRDNGAIPATLALAALADGLPPAAMACMTGPAPVSSMTWQFDLLTDHPTTRSGWWLCRSRADHIGNGYSGQSMMIWSADGQPVVAARQTVAVFA